MKKLYTSLFLGLWGLFFSVPFLGTVLAETINLVPEQTSPFTAVATGTPPTLSEIVTFGITAVLIVAAVAFFFMLVLGGIRWIMSGGEKGNVENARKQITNALIGLAIIFCAWAIIGLFNSLFGVNLMTGFEVPSLTK